MPHATAVPTPCRALAFAECTSVFPSVFRSTRQFFLKNFYKKLPTLYNSSTSWEKAYQGHRRDLITRSQRRLMAKQEVYTED